MVTVDTYGKERKRLRKVNLRPTRQRLALVRLLFAAGNRHATPEQLYEEARRAGIQVSLATIYNTLNHFTAAGLLRQVTVTQGRTFFDTNTDEHHHYYDEAAQQLIDLPAAAIRFEQVPQAPAGKQISGVDVVVRIR